MLPEMPGPHITEVRLFIKPQRSGDNPFRYRINYRYEVEYYMNGHGPILYLNDFPAKVDFFEVTATLVRPVRDVGKTRLINVQPGDTTSRSYAIAMDIGTTTIYGQVIDLISGDVLAEYGDFNGQISYGEDVISSNAIGKDGRLQPATLIIEANAAAETLHVNSRQSSHHPLPRRMGVLYYIELYGIQQNVGGADDAIHG